MMKARLRLISVIAMFGQAFAADATELRAGVEAFAGRPVEVDPRLAVPPCPQAIGYRWRGSSAVVASCEKTGWTLVIPVGNTRASSSYAARALPVVRRGDPVTVTAIGTGYRISIDGIAEGDGRPGGRLLVRNLRSGARITVSVTEDGSLVQRSAAY